MSSLTLSPWNDSTELMTVFNCIYNNNIENDFNYEMLLFAKNKLTIWLTRNEDNNDINVNLMGTKAILNALIEDNKREKVCDESVYSLYALSVIRFCTAISQYSNESNMKSVKRLAHKYSCPQWIIDCRHSLCHSSHSQPSIERLRNASIIALNWFKQYFWVKIIKNSYNDSHYFDLIHKYINSNDIKFRKKVRKHIIHSIESYKNEFILAVIKHLIDTNNELCNENNICYELLKLPKLYVRKFASIFTIINNQNSLSILLNLLINSFDSDKRSERHLGLSWFSSIIKAIKSDNKVSKFERSFNKVTTNSVMPKIQWIRLLYRIAKHPNEHTSSLISLIAPIVSDYISDKKIEIIVNLSKKYCAINDESDERVKGNGNDGKEYNIKSVKDLIQSIHGNNGLDSDISDTIDWSTISFGATHSFSTDENFRQLSHEK